MKILKKKKLFYLFRGIALCIFSSYFPLQIWTSKTCNKIILKFIKTCSLRFCQLEEDEKNGGKNCEIILIAKLMFVA